MINTFSSPHGTYSLVERICSLITNFGNAVKVKTKVPWKRILGTCWYTQHCLQFHHLLGGLTEFSLVLYLCFDLLQSEVTKQISKAKRCLRCGPGETRHSFPGSSPRGVAQSVLTSHDSKFRHDTCALSTRAAHLSLGIQVFSRSQVGRHLCPAHTRMPHSQKES